MKITLEDTFYRLGVAKFNQTAFVAAGYNATFYENLKEIAYDESTHVSFLTSALKGMPTHFEILHSQNLTQAVSCWCTRCCRMYLQL